MNRFIMIGLTVLLIAGGGWIFFKGDQGVKGNQAAVTRTVVGGDGKEVVIPALPKRVVIISSSGLDLYVAVGGESTIVGRAESPNLSEECKRKIEKAENVGAPSGVSLEKIIALKPDLVIGAEVTFQRQLEEPLKQANIPLLLIKTQSVEDNIKAIRLFGELTGKKEIADKKIGDIQSVIATLAKKKESAKPVRTLLIFGTPESFVVALPNSFPGDLLRLAGGVNVGEGLAPSGAGMAGSSYAPFSLEFALQAKPDQVFFITHGDPELMVQKFKETLSQNSAWSTIPAIRENRLAVVPFELAINPGSRTDEALLHIGKLLYPEGK